VYNLRCTKCLSTPSSLLTPLTSVGYSMALKMRCLGLSFMPLALSDSGLPMQVCPPRLRYAVYTSGSGCCECGTPPGQRRRPPQDKTLVGQRDGCALKVKSAGTTAVRPNNKCPIKQDRSLGLYNLSTQELICHSNRVVPFSTKA